MIEEQINKTNFKSNETTYSIEMNPLFEKLSEETINTIKKFIIQLNSFNK